MKEMEVKCYTKLDYIVLDSKGMNAFMILTQLLWQDKTMIHLCKIKYNAQEGTITIKTNEYRYEFKNVPLQWDGNIDTHAVYGRHIQSLKESEVI